MKTPSARGHARLPARPGRVRAATAARSAGARAAALDRELARGSRLAHDLAGSLATTLLHLRLAVTNPTPSNHVQDALDVTNRSGEQLRAIAQLLRDARVIAAGGAKPVDHEKKKDR